MLPFLILGQLEVGPLASVVQLVVGPGDAGACDHGGDPRKAPAQACNDRPQGRGPARCPTEGCPKFRASKCEGRCMRCFNGRLPDVVAAKRAAAKRGGARPREGDRGTSLAADASGTSAAGDEPSGTNGASPLRDTKAPLDASKGEDADANATRLRPATRRNCGTRTSARTRRRDAPRATMMAATAAGSRRQPPRTCRRRRLRWRQAAGLSAPLREGDARPRRRQGREGIARVREEGGGRQDESALLRCRGARGWQVSRERALLLRYYGDAIGRMSLFRHLA